MSARLLQVVNTYAQALGVLIAELWLYFVIGFLIAGAIAEFVPSATLLRHFGRNSAATRLRAMLCGLVASLCSCGAIPIAATMRARGATRAAALTFLLAAPWAGFTQVLIFYKFLGFTGMAVVFVGALTVAFLTGTVLAHLEDRGWLTEPAREAGKSNGLNVAPCENGECGCAAGANPTFHRRLLRACVEAWEAFLALWKYLAFGLLLAAALKAFVPMEWVGRFLGPQASFNPVLTAVPLAAAVELCSEGFSIFAGQLHDMGATLAVVFVVVLVGVTTDFTELSVIWGNFGKRSAIAYLLTATTLTLVFGLIIQQVFR